MSLFKSASRFLAAASLASTLVGTAQAAVQFADNPGRDFLIHGFIGSVYESFFFDITEPGTFLATLEDLESPVASSYLQLNIFDPTSLALGTTSVSPPATSSSFAFVGGAGTNFIAQVLGIGGDFQGIQVGNWKVTITQQFPIPEPGVWLMMAGGIVLLGWLRMRKSQFG